MLKTTTLIFVAVLFGACGSGLSKTDARAAFGATIDALDDAEDPDALVSVGEQFAADCAGGGSMVHKLAATVDENNVDATWDVTFTACNKDGVIMDGQVTWKVKIVNDATTQSVVAEYAGSLAYSGSISATCTMSIKSSVVIVDGQGSVDVTGDFCGYDGDTFVGSFSSSSIGS